MSPLHVAMKKISVLVILCGACIDAHVFPEGYTYLSATGNAYRLHKESTTWFNAKNMCAGEGAFLMYPEDEHEAKEVREHLNKMYVPEEFFIGLSDKDLEATFVTIDGKPIDSVYRNWAAEQPDNFLNQEDCVVLKVRGTLDDISCILSRPYVCKIARATLEEAAAAKRYRSDYKYDIETDTFYKLHTEIESRQQMMETCKAERASPVFASDITSLKAIFKNNQTTLNNGIWILDDDASLVNYTIEDFSKTECRAAYLDDANVTILPCTERLPFMCKVKADDTFYDEKCKVYAEGYTRYQYGNTSSCYRIPPQMYEWEQARQACEAEGAHLVIINSEAERDVVKGIMQDDGRKKFYLAGFRAEDYLRLVQTKDIVYKTIFNETLKETGYDTWEKKEPNNYHTTERCGSLFRSTGNLNDIFCSNRLPFICESSA